MIGDKMFSDIHASGSTLPDKVQQSVAASAHQSASQDYLVGEELS